MYSNFVHIFQIKRINHKKSKKKSCSNFDENENKIRDNNIQILIMNMINKLKECEETIKK